MGAPTFELDLVGPAGEAVDLPRTLLSHGVASLPPFWLDEEERRLEATLPLPGTRPRTVLVEQGPPGTALVTVLGPAVALGKVEAAVGRILRLDADLSAFYELAAADPVLSWATAGAGRMMRSATVFEDVVKTICTTNCSWSATVRMVEALVAHLGDAAPGAPATGARGRAFPTPAAMADVPEDFYREVIRAGYRGPYLRRLAESVASGEVDLEALGAASPEEMSDEEMGRRLQSLPGVGPYAAAHVMMMLGRHSLLILDSWTRPKYARLIGRRRVSDAAITRRFRRYGPYAGLAFWLFLTRDWVQEEAVGGDS